MSYSSRVKNAFDRLCSSKLCRTKQLTDANLDEVRKIFTDIVAPRDPTEMDTFAMMRGAIDAQLALKDSIKHSLSTIHTDHFSKYTVDKFAMITGMCADDRLCSTGGAHMIMFASSNYIVARLGLPITLNIFYRDRSGTFIVEVRDERGKAPRNAVREPVKRGGKPKPARAAPEPSDYFASARIVDMRETGDCRMSVPDLQDSSDTESEPEPAPIVKSKRTDTKKKTVESDEEPPKAAKKSAHKKTETAKKSAGARAKTAESESDESNSEPEQVPLPKKLSKSAKAKSDDIQTHEIVSDNKHWGSDDEAPVKTKKTK